MFNGGKLLAKPTYYLWLDKDTNMEELEKEKQKYLSAGFNVIICNNTSINNDIQTGLLNILKNHIK